MTSIDDYYANMKYFMPLIWIKAKGGICTLLADADWDEIRIAPGEYASPTDQPVNYLIFPDYNLKILKEFCLKVYFNSFYYSRSEPITISYNDSIFTVIVKNLNNDIIIEMDFFKGQEPAYLFDKDLFEALSKFLLVEGFQIND